MSPSTRVCTLYAGLSLAEVYKQLVTPCIAGDPSRVCTCSVHVSGRQLLTFVAGPPSVALGDSRCM